MAISIFILLQLWAIIVNNNGLIAVGESDIEPLENTSNFPESHGRN